MRSVLWNHKVSYHYDAGVHVSIIGILTAPLTIQIPASIAGNTAEDGALVWALPLEHVLFPSFPVCLSSKRT